MSDQRTGLKWEKVMHRGGRPPRERLRDSILKRWRLYVMILPGLLFVVMFKLIPYMGSVIAWKDFEFSAGRGLLEAILNSDFVGWKNFLRMFIRQDSLIAIRNTFIITGLKAIWLFPAPIILALMLNEVRHNALKRTMQTIVYFPNFLSWVVVSTMFLQLMQTGGYLNSLMENLGIPGALFFNNPSLFRTLLVSTDGWKNVGFGTIVYLAAIAGIDPSIYEAGIVDGCGRFKRILYITLPNILPVIALIFILSLGSQLAFGSFEQVMSMYNPAVYETGDIIQTYTYRMGLTKLDYSFATAVGLFNALVAILFIYGSNAMLRRATGQSIW